MDGYDLVDVEVTYDDADELLEVLAADDPDINRLPVVDEAGALMGIITRQDLLQALEIERTN